MNGKIRCFLVLMLLCSLLFNPAFKGDGGVFAASPLLENESGEVMVLQYHLIGYPEGDWRRTPENFRKDLEALYNGGYYPINLCDLVNRTFDVPKGKTPVVLTFDDSSEGQFRLIPSEKGWKIDLQSAVGIMLEFSRKHPDFPARGTFFVLPAIKKGLRLFGQEEYIEAKLKFLRDNGFEIGNHTYWHQNLGKSSGEEVQKQLILAQREIEKYLPGYKMTSLSLPFGVWSKPRELAVTGEYDGTSYKHDAIVLVGSGPAPSPFSKKFNPLAIERIQAGDTPWGVGAHIKRYEKKPHLRYVSDGLQGTLTFPADQENEIISKAGLKLRPVKTP